MVSANGLGVTFALTAFWRYLILKKLHNFFTCTFIDADFSSNPLTWLVGFADQPIFSGIYP
jgi:hypothetical protein